MNLICLKNLVEIFQKFRWYSTQNVILTSDDYLMMITVKMTFHHVLESDKFLLVQDISGAYMWEQAPADLSKQIGNGQFIDKNGHFIKPFSR